MRIITVGVLAVVLVSVVCQSAGIKVLVSEFDQIGPAKYLGSIQFELKSSLSSASIEIKDQELYNSILKVLRDQTGHRKDLFI